MLSFDCCKEISDPFLRCPSRRDLKILMTFIIPQSINLLTQVQIHYSITGLSLRYSCTSTHVYCKGWFIMNLQGYMFCKCQSISRNVRSKGIDNCCGLYIRVYFRITLIDLIVNYQIGYIFCGYQHCFMYV